MFYCPFFSKEFYSCVCVCVSQESLPVSPANGMVSRFLDEETLRSEELLHRFDVHIQNMKDSNANTVSKYLSSGSELKPAQAPVQTG